MDAQELEQDDRPEIELGEGTPPEDAPENEDPIEADRLFNFLDGLGAGEGYVEVYILRKNGTRGYKGKYDPETFDLDDIRDAHGGGRFQFRVHGPKRAYIGSQTIHIDGPEKDSQLVTEADSLADKYEAATEELRTMLEDLKADVPGHGGNSMTELLKVFMSAMTYAQGMNAPYLELLAQNRNQGSSADELVKMLIKGMELGREQNPEPDPYARVLGSLGPPILQAIGANTLGAAAPGLPAPPAPGAPPVEMNLNPQPRPEWEPLLAPFLPHLQEWAAAGKNPDLRAQLVVDDLPQPVLPLLLGQLGRGEEFLAEFFATRPETRPHETWYRMFWEAIRDQFDWEEEAPEGQVEEYRGADEVAPAPREDLQETG